MWRVNSRCVTSPRDFETCNGEESKGKIQVVNWIKKTFCTTFYTIYNFLHVLGQYVSHLAFLYMFKS